MHEDGKFNDFDDEIKYLNKFLEKTIIQTILKECLEKLKQKKIIKQFCVNTIENISVEYYYKKENNLEGKLIQFYTNKYVERKDKKSFMLKWTLFHEIITLGE